MRQLIHVPMLHSTEQLLNAAEDTLSPSFRREALAGAEASRPYSNKFWSIVHQGLKTLDVGANTPRIYLEGYSGRPRLVAPRQSYKLRLDPSTPEGIIIGNFIDQKGAKIEPIENRRLVRKAKANYRQLGRTKPMSREEKLAFDAIDETREERDRFVATRIGDTLQPDEVGVLFLGWAHEPLDHLAPDIQTTVLDERLKEIVQEMEIAKEGPPDIDHEGRI